MATEGERYSTFLANKGLRVEEKQGKQRTLFGNEVDYHTITGVKEGEYRITVHLKPGPTRAQLVIHATSREKADKAAKKLSNLGFKVDVDEERVSATTRRPTLAQLSRAIDAAEEATKH